MNSRMSGLDCTVLLDLGALQFARLQLKARLRLPSGG